VTRRCVEKVTPCGQRREQRGHIRPDQRQGFTRRPRQAAIRRIQASPHKSVCSLRQVAIYSNMMSIIRVKKALWFGDACVPGIWLDLAPATERAGQFSKSATAVTMTPAITRQSAVLQPVRPRDRCVVAPGHKVSNMMLTPLGDDKEFAAKAGAISLRLYDPAQ